MLFILILIAIDHIELKGIGKVKESDPVPYQMALDCMAGKETTVASVQSAISDSSLTQTQMQTSHPSQASLSSMFTGGNEESQSGSVSSVTDGSHNVNNNQGEGKPLLSQAQQLLKKAIIVLGPANCTVINNSDGKLCVLTFNKADLFFTNYSHMYTIDTGQSQRVEALSDPNGLFVAIVYKAVDNYLHYKRWHCANGSELTVMSVNKQEIQVSGENAELKGIGKIKENSSTQYQMAIDTLANRAVNRGSIRSSLGTTSNEEGTNVTVNQDPVNKSTPADKLIKSAAQLIAHSSCNVINKTTYTVCLITFNKADIFLSNYNNFYIIPPDVEINAEGLWDINGLFVAVVFKAADSWFHYKRWLCANDSSLTITYMRKYDIHVEGNGIELKGVGKLKVNDPKTYKLVSEAIADNDRLPPMVLVEEVFSDPVKSEDFDPIVNHTQENNEVIPMKSTPPKEIPPPIPNPAEIKPKPAAITAKQAEPKANPAQVKKQEKSEGDVYLQT